MESNTNTKKYCISVDGSEYSDWGFELVMNELYNKGDKIVVVHIANPAKISEIPYAFQPDTIVSKYETKLTGKLLEDDYIIVRKDREDQVHSLELVNHIANGVSSSVLVIGYQGHKANKQKNELSKGIVYIIKNIKLPTFIIKELSQRKNKENAAFTWMVCIKEANSKSFKAFKFALGYISKKDIIKGVHIQTQASNKWVEKDIKENFEKICKSYGFDKFSLDFIPEETGVSLGKKICNLVNFNEMYVDFLVVGHHPEKNTNMDGLPSSEIIKNAKANVLFYSE